MKYIGNFTSINNIDYKVEIETKTSGADKEILLSGNPFVASIEPDEDMLYNPIKCGGATVGVITENYISDFYTGEAKGVKVTLTNETESGKIEWIGYVTPNIYSQGFETFIEELELECVDGIAVLKNIYYIPEEDDGEIKTFLEIIYKCLKYSEVYKYFYISDNVQFTQTGADSIIEKIRVSEANFLSERNDPNQTMDDIASSAYDILFQLLQYLGYTLIIEGNEVFIIDYDAIKKGKNTYWKYALDTPSITRPSYVTVEYSKFIDGDDYVEGGTNIEMTEVFNKITVKDEFNTFDSLFPHYDDIAYQTNITPEVDDDMPIGIEYNSGNGGEPKKESKVTYKFSTIMYEELNGKKDYFYAVVFRGWKSTDYAAVIKFYDNAIFNMHKYPSDSSTITDITSDARFQGQCKYSDMLKFNGAYYYRYWIGKLDRFDDWYRKYVYTAGGSGHPSSYNWVWDRHSMQQKIQYWKDLCAVNQFNLKPITMFKNGGSKPIKPGNGINLNNKVEIGSEELANKYPYMTIKEKMANKIFGGQGATLTLKGSFMYHSQEYQPMPFPEENPWGDKLEHHHDTKDTDEGYLWAKLRWGDRYWNGIDWVYNSDTFFKIYYYSKNISRDERKNHSLWARWKGFTKYNAPEGEEQDLVIPCPEGFNLQGEVELNIYTRSMHGDSRRSHWPARGTEDDNFYCRYYTKVGMLKDFDIIPEVQTSIINDGSGETDTIYTNVISNGSIQKMDEITFKVCTYDYKNPNYSSVDYIDENGNSQYVKTLYNKALYDQEKDSVGCDGIYGAFRQEEHYIFKVATQYENPHLIYDCNIQNEGHKMYGTYTNKTLSDIVFIATEREIDYKFNKCNLKLTGKE